MQNLWYTVAQLQLPKAVQVSSSVNYTKRENASINAAGMQYLQIDEFLLQYVYSVSNKTVISTWWYLVSMAGVKLDHLIYDTMTYTTELHTTVLVRV